MSENELKIKFGKFYCPEIKKSKLWSKLEILVEIRNFVQKSKFWSKNFSLIKNPNFGQKSKV